MIVQFDTPDGRRDFVVPNSLITEFLNFVFVTNGWKDRPDVLHERTLRFRKLAVEQRVVADEAPAKPKAPASAPKAAARVAAA